ncbi:MAG: hypothetical protein J2P57_15780 [Acidimicrobiaceae bacterium]|nr:hypothetical protein [Acidimicrobiaceae bacterium]
MRSFDVSWSDSDWESARRRRRRSRPPGRRPIRSGAAPILTALSLFVPLLAGMGLVSSGGLAQAAPASPWRVAGQIRGAQTFDSVSCADSAHCVAVGDTSAATTTDGGATWAYHALPPGGVSAPNTIFPLATTFPSQVSCATTADCWAVGPHGIVHTADGGSTWTRQTPPAGTPPLNVVSCASSTHCWAVGSFTASTSSRVAVIATTDGGATWATQTTLTGFSFGQFAGEGIACPSASECVLVGRAKIASTSDGGATWNARIAPGGVAHLEDISCANASDCWALGSGLIATRDGGATWTRQTLPKGVPFLFDLSCPTASTCLAVGGGGAAGTVASTTDGGATWTARPRVKSQEVVYGLSCPTASDCHMLGFVLKLESTPILATTDGGNSWTRDRLPQAVSLVGRASCPTASDCWMLALDQASHGIVVATTDGGKTWAHESLPPGLGTSGMLSDLSCPTTSNCWAVRGSPLVSAAIAATADGGATWSEQQPPAGISSLTAVSCPTSRVCWAIGTRTGGAPAVIATIDGGATWTSETIPAGLADLSALSCPTMAFCLATGDNTTPPTSPTFPHGTVVLRTTDGGSTWARVADKPQSLAFRAVACPNASDCWVSGRPTPRPKKPPSPPAIAATTDGGSTWNQQQTPSSIPEVDSLACPTSNYCWALGLARSLRVPDDLLTTDAGATWPPQALPGAISRNALRVLACAAAARCLAVGQAATTANWVVVTT